MVLEHEEEYSSRGDRVDLGGIRPLQRDAEEVDPAFVPAEFVASTVIVRLPVVPWSDDEVLYGARGAVRRDLEGTVARTLLDRARAHRPAHARRLRLRLHREVRARARDRARRDIPPDSIPVLRRIITRISKPNEPSTMPSRSSRFRRDSLG
jgi:hypothetical protein